MEASIKWLILDYDYRYKHILTFMATSILSVVESFGKKFRRRLKKVNNVLENYYCRLSILRAVLGNITTVWTTKLTCQGTTLIPIKIARYLRGESKVYEFSKSWPHVDWSLSPAFNQPLAPHKATHPPFWKQIKCGHVRDHRRSGGGNYLP